MSAKVIMIQGTMSNSGKSFLTAALCRIFYQDGYKCAPFKSQNMALNSYITKEGLEIGRAQAMQAEAAHIEPTVYMNPILLKPTSHTGSQVIVNGEVYGNMSAAEYYAKKTEMKAPILNAYHKLEEEYDIIVIEGAGSPAEINLKENDIVNMGMAAMADAPVLLVGDIDRGGVFASLYGTIALLEKEEQDRIKGIIINKFRGDVEILKPGLKMIEEKSGKRVVGVVPMENLDIDDEDSLSERLNQREAGIGLDVCVIKLPHISNFTDFNAFDRIPGVSLRYADRADRLGEPDFILLPGSKNTMADLQWLRESGMETLLLRLSERKVPVMGVCGGYQMLGKELKDPHQVEHGGSMRGLGLLDAVTVFEQAKTRTRINGRLLYRKNLLEKLGQSDITGYEIHMGETVNCGGCESLIELEDGRFDGLVNEDGSVMGTYLHGIFDNRDFMTVLLAAVAQRKGIALEGTAVQPEEYKEQQYDKLADLVRKSLDMEYIYKVLRQE